MKIRQGFVSNSSTSSFAVFGLFVENESALRRKLKATEEDNINDLLKPHNVQFLEYHGDETDYFVVGVDLEQLRGSFDQKIETIKKANDGLNYLYRKNGQFQTFWLPT
jgi:hypothetical protein